jgi:hypothetical protein
VSEVYHWPGPGRPGLSYGAVFTVGDCLTPGEESWSSSIEIRCLTKEASETLTRFLDGEIDEFSFNVGTDIAAIEMPEGRDIETLSFQRN